VLSFRERRVGLLEYEVWLLLEAGYGVTGHSQDSGLAVIEVIAADEKTGIGDLRLEVTLPASYPLMPPRVVAPDLDMRHHQNPFVHDLCLLERSTENWDWQWRVAGLLDKQLKKALAAGTAAAGQGLHEVDQGEPFSVYYTYVPGMHVLIDSATIDVGIGGHGDMELCLAGPVPPPIGERLLGLVRWMRSDGALVYEAPAALTAMYGDQPVTVRGRWVVLDEPVREDDAKAIWDAARSADPQPTRAFTYSGRTLEARGIGFAEEHARGRNGTGWVFVLKQEGQHTQQRRKPKTKGGDPRKLAAQKSNDLYHLARAMRAGRDDMTFRAPETRGLADQKVLVLGCGAIGSVLTEHLARAGVGEIHLLDMDELEPGNLSRHAGSFQSAGIAKSIGMARRVLDINPYSRVEAFKFAIGAPRLVDEQRTETDWLREKMDVVDLIVDATAEIGVHELTSAIALEACKPWVMLSASPGIGGGTVVRIDPDARGCFACFQWHHKRGTIPMPPAVEIALVQPAGCAQPTFTGSGFDLALVSAQAARVIVSRLLRGTDGGYPEDGYDAHILTLRDKDGNPQPPHWDGFHVDRHPECAAH